MLYTSTSAFPTSLPPALELEFTSDMVVPRTHTNMFTQNDKRKPDLSYEKMSALWVFCVTVSTGFANWGIEWTFSNLSELNPLLPGCDENVFKGYKIKAFSKKVKMD